jgi:hypothetical protein
MDNGNNLFGRMVTYWTASEDTEGRDCWSGSPALIVGTHIRGPIQRTTDNPRDVFLVVFFSPRTGAGGGVGNRYVPHELWGLVTEGGLTPMPDGNDPLGAQVRPRHFVTSEPRTPEVCTRCGSQDLRRHGADLYCGNCGQTLVMGTR